MVYIFFFFHTFEAEWCIGTWSLCKTTPATADWMRRYNFAEGVMRRLETPVQPKLLLEFKARHLRPFRARLAHNRLPTSRRGASQIFAFCQNHSGLQNEHGIGSRHVGSRALRESKCMAGWEDPETSRTIHLWFSIATELLLRSSSEKKVLTKFFFPLSFVMYTHCTHRQRKWDVSVALCQKTAQHTLNDTYYVQ